MVKQNQTTSTIEVHIDGDREHLAVEDGETLMSSLRRAGYYSVKNGCDEGVCGACNVILDDEGAIRSCLVSAASCDGASVTTVEGLLDEDGELHPLQEEFLDRGAAQCGYCIPGVLVSAYDLLQHNPDPTAEDAADALSGNICRCTGYVQQVEAIQAAAERLPDGEAAEGAD